MMRIGHLACLVPLAVLIAVVPAKAEPPAPRIALLVQPGRGDFDRDGRVDIAAGVLTDPSIVRVTLSGTGIRDLSQPARVLAVAAFDYDADGDLDLLVGTSRGTVVWRNDGHGVFSGVPLALTTHPPIPSPSVRTTAPTPADASPEPREPAIALHDRDGPAGLLPIDRATRRSPSPTVDATFSTASSRAPPRA